MKMKHTGVSYNGGSLKDGTFAYVVVTVSPDPTVKAEERGLIFRCRGGRFDNRSISITKGEPKEPVWHWDGNVEEPTITPSIGCDKRCGWHGSITKGEIEP